MADGMALQTKHFYAFGPFRLDAEKRVLVRDGTPLLLAPKAAEALLVLVENAGHLVDKAPTSKIGATRAWVVLDLAASEDSAVHSWAEA